MMRNPVHELVQGFPFFNGGSNIQKNQFICPFACIQFGQFNGISGIPDRGKVYPFYGSAVSDI